MKGLHESGLDMHNMCRIFLEKKVFSTSKNKVFSNLSSHFA